MKTENYFNKNGYIFGVEGDLTDSIGYRVYIIQKFTDYYEAIEWTKNAPHNRRRFLANYTEMKYLESHCLVN